MSRWMGEGKLMFSSKDYLTFPVHCTVHRQLCSLWWWSSTSSLGKQWGCRNKTRAFSFSFSFLFTSTLTLCPVYFNPTAAACTSPAVRQWAAAIEFYFEVQSVLSSSWSISAWISELAMKLCVRTHLLLSGITFPSTVLHNKKWMKGFCHREIKLNGHTLNKALATTTSVPEVCNTLDMS